MFRNAGIYSRAGQRPASVLAVAIFGCGLVIGAAVGAQMAGGRGVPVAAAVPLAPRQPAVSRAGHPAEALRIIDGDTFAARVHIWPGIAITTKVRLRGIDAPEMRARCRQERLRAEAARDALGAMLAAGGVGVSMVSRDKYGGRVVADASARGTPDVAQALLAAGLVRRYDGGRRRSWCDGKDD